MRLSLSAILLLSTATSSTHGSRLPYHSSQENDHDLTKPDANDGRSRALKWKSWKWWKGKGVKSQKGKKACLEICPDKRACRSLFNPDEDLVFDQNVTPSLIFGSGNDNGSFTIATNEELGIEIGLRGKLRFDSNGNPQNTFNSQGDGTYRFEKGVGRPPNSNPLQGEWSFEWSVNSNVTCMEQDPTPPSEPCTQPLDSFDYELGLDGVAGTDQCRYAFWDPINVPCADHSLGTGSTGNGAGIETNCGTADAFNYENRTSQFSVAQQSWQYGFFNTGGNYLFNDFNPNVSGVYNVYLKVLEKETRKELAKVSIHFLISMPEILSDCNSDVDLNYDDLFDDEDECIEFIEELGSAGDTLW